jgi:choline dehydrogenase-like flavoprotein
MQKFQSIVENSVRMVAHIQEIAKLWEASGKQRVDLLCIKEKKKSREYTNPATTRAFLCPPCTLRSIFGRPRTLVNFRIKHATAWTQSDVVECIHFIQMCRSWQGPNMSVFSRQVADWQGTGYGALLYNPAAHPGLFAAAAPWLSGRDFKDLLQQYRNSVAVLVLVRDQGCGKVTVDASGYPRLHYSISPRDRNSMIKGIIAGLRALEAAGATKLMTLLNSEKGRCSLPPASQTPGAERSSARDTDRSEVFEAYVQRMEAIGVPPLSMPTFSAHQLGTASMGVGSTTSVVDPLGESWEVEGLFVCDGSVLPTSTGVNPMISIEAVAYFIAEGIRQKVAKQVKPAAGSGLAYDD